MIRFISFLLGHEYETCKSCAILKEQLQLVNEEKKQLTETLLAIIKPQAPLAVENVNQPVALPVATTFTRRRAALEERDRLAAKTVRESKVLGMPDNATTRDIEKLEKNLGIEPSDERSEEEA